MAEELESFHWVFTALPTLLCSLGCAPPCTGAVHSSVWTHGSTTRVAGPERVQVWPWPERNSPIYSPGKAQKRNPGTQRRSWPAALLTSFRGSAIPGAIMGLCAPSLRHPHLLRGTICDQPGMSGMTHKPQQDLSEQRNKSQEARSGQES